MKEVEFTAMGNKEIKNGKGKGKGVLYRKRLGSDVSDWGQP